MKQLLAFSLLGLSVITGCNHKPPVAELLNQDAAIPAGAPVQPLDWRVITSTIDPTRQTMATLFGNDRAIESARTPAHTSYPAGSILALVTWSQKEDPHWFGGRMPSRFESMEIVRVAEGKPGTSGVSYQRLEGKPLRDVPVDPAEADVKKNSLLALRASVMP
jgi:hypothetical protein